MEKIERINNFPNVKGFETHYNKYPSELIEKIDEDTFIEMLLHYSWDYEDSRQIIEEGGNQKLFIMLAFDLVVGIMVHKSTDNPVYYKFGDWKTFNRKFIAQFQGDIS